MVRKLTALLTGVCLCLSAWTFVGPNTVAEEITNTGEETVTLNYNTDKEMPNFYSDVAATYPTDSYADEAVSVVLENGVTTDGLAVSCVDGRILWDDSISEITWPMTVPQDGKYVLRVRYQSVGDVGNDMVRALKLDGQSPFYEAESITFYNSWTDEGDVTVNSIGDQVRPGVVQVKGYQEAYVVDSLGWYAEPLVFYLTAGEHQLTLSFVSQSLDLAGLIWEPYQATPSYKEVSSTYPTESNGTIIQVFQAEDTMTVKNDATIRLESDGDPATYPQSLGYRVFNTIGGWRWRAGNQSVTMEFEVEQEGWYQLGFRYLHSWNDGLPTHRTILLNDVVPFSEMYDYRFDYSQDWQTEVLHDEEGQPYLFYLKKGLNKLEMRVTMGEIQPLLQSLYSDLLSISAMLQDINELTGNDPDPNYDYEFFRYIPTLEGDLTQLAESLEYKHEYLKTISSKNTSLGSNLKSSAEQIWSFVEDPFSLAARISQLTQMQTNLGAWYSDIQNQPLLLDEFTFASAQAKITHRKSNFFQRLWATLVNFGMSFVKDYDNIAGASVDMNEISNVLNVWISRGTEWAEIVKEMADEDFTPDSKTLININIVPASQLNTGSANALMLAIVSGDAPDVAMGVASNSPVEFAIRDAVLDLSQFDDYAQVEDRFLENIMVAYRYRDGVYALPETMNFSALFYRTDIFEKYGLDLPDTRQDLYDTLLPALYQLGMEYYQPADYLPFLLQRNGAYYTEDGLKSALDTAEAFLAFEEFTQMFTHYSAPVSANFFNRFRTGEMPIGIGNYALYIQLSTAAPELLGRWAIAPLPGMKQEDGSVNRASGGIAGECDIILAQTENAQQAWDFLSWWTSEKTQIEYARELEALVGVEARWNTSNVKAFHSLNWDPDDVRVFEEQWKWAREIPVVLGGYYTQRYVNNAFNSVVVSGTKTPRDALEDAVKEINRELKMKQDEYGVTVG